MENALAVIPDVDVSKLDTAKPLTEIFQPFETTLAKWQAKVNAMVVTDISQTTEMEQARLARLDLRKSRVLLDKTRLGLVEGLKDRTKRIDGAARAIRESMEELEGKLLSYEEFGDRYRAEQKAKLKAAREAEYLPLSDSPLISDLSDLSAPDFKKLVEDAKLLRQAKADAARKLEEDRLAKLEAERLERERIVAENARLAAEAKEARRIAEEQKAAARSEADRIEKERAAERAAAEAALKEEQRKAKVEADRQAMLARKEHARLEAERDQERKAAQAAAKIAAEEAAQARALLAAAAQAQEEEQARQRAEQAKADKAAKVAAAAPDNAKLSAFAQAVRALEIPSLKNHASAMVLAAQRENFAAWVEEQMVRV